MKIFLQLCIIFCCYSTSKAQQPAYTLFGEDQFHGIQVYDIIQDKQLNFWFATNEGIYFYDFISFKKVECLEAKSNSAFNFEIDEEGVIYCHNLNNQVFQIKNNSCSLFYELKEDEGGPDLRLIVAPDGNIIVGAKKIVVLDKNAKIKSSFNSSKGYLSSPTVFGEEVHFLYKNNIVAYSKGEFSNHNIQISSDLQIETLNFFRFNGRNYAMTAASKKVLEYNPKQFALRHVSNWNSIIGTNMIRIYETEKAIWLAGTLPGVKCINSMVNQTSKLPVFYSDYFISCVFEDKEGNILMGTFDKGILVIPNQKIKTLTIQTKEDPISALFPSTKRGLILGSSKGKILSFSKSLDTLSLLGNRPIEKIISHEGSDLIIYDDGNVRAMNLSSGKTYQLVYASMKDGAFASENSAYIGSNIGIHKVEWNKNLNFTVNHVPALPDRVHCLDVHQKTKSLYVSTSKGFFVYSKEGSIQEIRYKGEALFPNDVYYHNNYIYLTTKAQGILVIRSNKVIRQIIPGINGEQLVLKKLVIYNNTFFANSSSGFYQFSLNGKLLKSIHSIVGLTSKRVIDFVFQNDKLWVSHAGGVQQIDLNYIDNSTEKPLLRLDKIRINDEVYHAKKSNIFSSNTKKVQFVFSSPSLRNRETTSYHYRLKGNDKKWNVIDYSNHDVTYNALSPGAYTFQIKSECRGNFSEITSVQFQILPPIYQRWWFISAAILLFLGLVIFTYKRQLKVQQRKSQQINELNASKLTAIQSQMNPHFIFNSLNSIQDLILKGDVEHSYSYITTFSNLVRRTLNYSEKDFIYFDQEVKLLELYLSLEQLRFKKDFIFRIETNEISDIMIPPLLIQPFIENSLVHGLLHREGQKNLVISFRLENVLICTIEDNGVGRKKSKEIKMRQRAEHESFSSKAIEKRFDILSNVFKGDFGFTYEDLYENGEATGTRVILKIPVKHNY